MLTATLCSLFLISQWINYNSGNAAFSPESSVDDDIIVFNPKYQLKFAQGGKKCKKANSVFYNGRCYKFGKRGPCKRDEYLGYDESSSHNRYLKPVCVRKPSLYSNGHQGKSDLSSGLALAELPALIDHEYQFSFTQEEKKCHKANKVFYNGRCYKIGKRGPCKKFEYLVYDKFRAQKGDGALKPICQRKPCPHHYQYMVAENKCYHNDDILRYCPNAQETKIKIDLYGELYCQCYRGGARVLGSNSSECYNLYYSNPCEPGSLFLPVVDFINFGFGQCRPSPCDKYHVKVRLDNRNKQCLRFQSYDEPCNHEEMLNFDYTDSFPGIFSFSCQYKRRHLMAESQLIFPVDCVENNRGECVKTLKHTPLDAYDFYLD